MENLNREVIKCTMDSDKAFYIIQGGKTYKNKFFYETRTNSDVFIFEYVTSGSGFIIIEDKMYNVKEGDFYIIPTNRTYEYFTDSENPYERLWFYGRGNLFENLYKTYFDSLSFALSHGDFNQNYNNIMFLLRKGIIDSNSYNNLSIEIFKLFLKANENIKTSKSVHTPIKKNSLASKIKGYLISHFNEKFDLKALSKEFLTSPNKIIIEFKKAYNLTPQVFHMMYKMDIAEEMIKRGMTKKEIASNLAFYDDKYFYKMYKKYKLERN